jgi:hypothetical protein
LKCDLKLTVSFCLVCPRALEPRSTRTVGAVMPPSRTSLSGDFLPAPERRPVDVKRVPDAGRMNDQRCAACLCAQSMAW